MCVLYVYVTEERAPLAASDCNHGVAHRQSDFRIRAGRVDLAVRIDALRIDLRATELAGRCREMLEIVERGRQQLPGGRLQRIVDGGLQLIPNDEIDHERRGQDSERNRGSSDECETGAKAHGSRSA